ncbi:hypothetical protein [Minwuia sp.]|uniref:hypothetical protein n=1 Tax=Minwuia sp. TaxID=2493630 RepID=UPI003A92AF76
MTSNVRIENVKTRFTEMATKPAHVKRSEALMKANSAMVGLKDEAGEWIDKDIARLSELVGGWKAAGLTDPDTSDQAYRTVCSIRDTSGHFGQNSLCLVADSFCELIFRMTEAKAFHAEALQTHLNALKLVHRSDMDTLPEAAVAQLAANLKSLTEIFPDPDAKLRQQNADARAARKKEAEAEAAARAAADAG